MTLRAEFFNLLNHPNFSNPLLPNFIGNIGAPDAATGQHSGYYSLTATGDVGIGNPFLGGGAPRGVQFAREVDLLIKRGLNPSPCFGRGFFSCFFSGCWRKGGNR